MARIANVLALQKIKSTFSLCIVATYSSFFVSLNIDTKSASMQH